MTQVWEAIKRGLGPAVTTTGPVAVMLLSLFGIAVGVFIMWVGLRMFKDIRRRIREMEDPRQRRAAVVGSIAVVALEAVLFVAVVVYLVRSVR
jgi:uncharacterized membrane protein YidH (DUF202 family)